MSIDRLLSQYSAPVASWPGEEDLDDEARANLAASTRKLATEGGATDAGSLLPITRYPTRVGTDPATWTSASDVMASLDDGWRLEPFNRISAPFKSMLDGLRTQPLLGPMVRPSQMQPEVLEQMTGDAMSVAGAGLMGNVPRVLAGAPAGTIDFGIFGGRRGAETLAAKGEPRPLQALDMVEAMERAGKSRDEIWSATSELLKDTPYAGAFRGVDKEPRFEISDKHDFVETPDGGLKETGAVMRTRDKTMAGPLAQGHTPRATLGQLMTHDDLFAAYPELKRMNVVSSGERGGWQHGETIGLGRELLDGLNDPTRTEHITKPQRVALHEIQHRIQDIEGTGAGGSPHQMKEYLVNRNDAQIEALSDRIREIEESYPAEFDSFRRLNGATAMKNWDAANAAEAELLSTPIGRELADLDWRRAELERQDFEGQPAFDAYKMLAGETESRTVEKRRTMSADERRARAPWRDYDVPESDQIVRFGDSGRQMSIDPAAPHPIDKLLDEVAPPTSAPVSVPTSLDPLGGAVTPPVGVPDFAPARRVLQAAVPRDGARSATEILDLYSKD